MPKELGYRSIEELVKKKRVIEKVELVPINVRRESSLNPMRKNNSLSLAAAKSKDRRISMVPAF